MARAPKEGDGKPVRATAGYQAPPLDGVWATAPYFHNGSVPTLAGVLNSKARPKVFTRSYHTGEEDYDKDKVKGAFMGEWWANILVDRILRRE